MCDVFEAVEGLGKWEWPPQTCRAPLNAARSQVCAVPRLISSGIYVFLKFISNFLGVLTLLLFLSAQPDFLNVQ